MEWDWNDFWGEPLEWIFQIRSSPTESLQRRLQANGINAPDEIIHHEHCININKCQTVNYRNMLSLSIEHWPRCESHKFLCNWWLLFKCNQRNFKRCIRMFHWHSFDAEWISFAACNYQRFPITLRIDGQSKKNACRHWRRMSDISCKEISDFFYFLFFSIWSSTSISMRFFIFSNALRRRRRYSDLALFVDMCLMIPMPHKFTVKNTTEDDSMRCDVVLHNR